MGMNLSIKTETFNPDENQEWLGSAHGTQECDSITLDGALTAAVYADGIVPSGIPLGKVTATGLYAPAVTTAVDGSQTVVGHLFTSVDTTAGGKVAAATDTPASLLWHGEVVVAKVPTYANDPDLTTAGAPHVRYV